MKRFHLRAAIVLLIAAAWYVLPRGSRDPAGSPDSLPSDSAPVFREKREAAGSSSAPVPPRASYDHGTTGAAAGETGSHALHSHPVPVSRNGIQRRTLPVDSTFVTGLASGPDEVSIALPDGRTAAGVIERRYIDAAGNPDGVEGRLTKPSEGRFRFRLQPAGDKAGPVTGTVHMVSDPIAFRVLKDGSGGGSLLTELPKDEVICLMPAPSAEQLAAEAANAAPEEIPAEHPTGIPIPPYQNGVIPLQSRPGAVGVIYLDFDGEPGPHEGWGDFDAAPSGATNTQVKDVWVRVAEDYAPFNLNVTTDLQVFLKAPPNSRQRCIITPTTTAAPSAGGVAYVGDFNSIGDSPCWSFYATGKSAAEAISHEIGHTLGLSHDGRTTPDEEYYAGHGTDPVGWAPIMGTGYSKNLTQWSKGEYTSANQLQDDLSIISNNNNNVGYRTDDAGPDHASAAVLQIFGRGNVDDEGIISQRTDVDAYRFTTTGGAVNLAVNPVSSGPNLDISASIWDSAGNQIIVSNPDTALNATLATTLPAGEYTVRVDGVGRGNPLTTGYPDYGSLGQYTITGTIAGATGPSRFSVAENAAAGTVAGTPALRSNHGIAALTWAITAGNTGSAFAINPTSGQITVATPSMLDYEALAGNWLNPPTFNLTVSVTDGTDPLLNEVLPVVVTITDVNEPPVLTAAPITALGRTVAGTVLGTLTATDTDQFDYISFSIISGNGEGKFSINNSGQILAAGSWDTVQSSYVLTIRATDHGTPALAVDAVVNVTVVPVAAPYTPGVVYHTIYDGITGSDVTSLTDSASFPDSASQDVRIDDFTDNTRGNIYGSTVRAWLIAPATGTYRFWISGDEATELYFNAAGNPAAITRIAYRTTYTGYQSFDESTTQKSADFALTAGQVCYIEARHKELIGGDHLSVAWDIRNASTSAVIQARQVIPGRYLSPHLMNYAPRVTAAEGVVYRNAYLGATAFRPVSADTNAGDTATWAITGGNAGNLFAIDAATGRIYVTDAAGLAASTAVTIPVTVTATDNRTPPLSGSAVITLRMRAPDFITTAGLVQEFWDNVPGSALSALYNLPRYQEDRPDRLRGLTSFNSGENLGDNYGSRIRVLVTPPTTGTYKFYIASDDNSVLRLGTDATPGSASQIASVSGSTGYLKWTTQASQTSAAVTLTAGRKYFLEAIMKEGTGGDHLSVAWTGPGITAITLLRDANTEPYDSNKAPVFSAASYSFASVANASQGQLIGTVAAADAPFDEICYGILSGNAGSAFTIDPVTGVIRVASTSGLVPGASYQLQIGAQDTGHGRNFAPRAATVLATVTVPGADQLPRFPDPPVLGSYLLNQPLSIDLREFITDPGDALAFTGISVPPWLTLSPAGFLTGNPAISQIGPWSLAVSVSDTHAHTVQGTLQFNVTGPGAVAGSTLLLDDGAGIMIAGTVSSGSNANTVVADASSLVFREINAGTAPGQLSLFEYRWTFSVPVNRPATLRVKAHHSPDPEDDFLFTVSTDNGATWQDAIRVTATASSGLIQTYTFPTGTMGQVLVKLSDTDRTPGMSALHDIAIDQMQLDIIGNAMPVITDATFGTIPHAATGTLLGTVSASAADAGQALVFSITRGNEAGLFAIDAQGRLTVAGDVPASPSSHSLIVAVTDNGAPPLSAWAVVTMNVGNPLVIAGGSTIAWSGGTHSHPSLVNDGTLRLADPAVLDVPGNFTNNGVLDLIHWSGTLPPGFVNNGIVLDRSAVRVLSSSKSGDTFHLTIAGYTGHNYQLKTSTDLSGPWADSGAAVPGTGTPSSPQEIPFSAPATEGSRFYRIAVNPAF